MPKPKTGINRQQQQQQQPKSKTYSSRSISSFKASDVKIQLLAEEQRQQKPKWESLVFGHQCSDHMIKIHYDGGVWRRPQILPVHNISLHPFSKVFHYALELFEGLKAYRSPEGEILLFRPELNIQRMQRSAERLCFPSFDGQELLKLLKKLISVEESWVPPYESKCSLYIRPTMIGTEPTLGVSPSSDIVLFVVLSPVGPYFSNGFKPVSLYASPDLVRSWPGGCGDRKLGSNYAPTVKIQKDAQEFGHQQVLWLFGADHQITEVGTMNVFFLIEEKDGKKVLITPPLTDLILPGITRQSIIELVRSWNEIDVVERVITMNELQQLLNEKRLLEVFGAGTACVVCSVKQISYLNKTLKIPDIKFAARLLEEMTKIHHGIIRHQQWSVPITERMTV